MSNEWHLPPQLLLQSVGTPVRCVRSNVALPRLTVLLRPGLGSFGQTRRWPQPVQSLGKWSVISFLDRHTASTFPAWAIWSPGRYVLLLRANRFLNSR